MTMEEEDQERRPLINSSRRRSRRESVVSYHEQDAENPLDWSKRYRWSCVALLCVFSATVSYTCIGIVPVAGDVVTELKGYKDPSAAVLFVTIWEFGEAIGPLFMAPLSELYGRFVVYNVANLLFIASVVVTALSQDINLLIFTRFTTGCAVAANVLNPAIIGDLFPSKSRGAAMSAVMLAPLIGGTLGPTVSGKLAEALGWRAIVWICVGVATMFEILLFTLFRETYSPVILRRRAAKKRKETGDDSYISEYGEQEESTVTMLKESMLRPVRIFWGSSMLQCLSIWGGATFAFFYINSTSLPEILEVVYDFSPSKRGVAYLAWSAGSLISIVICNLTMDKIYNKLGKRHGGFYPEGRMPLVITGALMLPIAATLYGWTAQMHTNVFIFLSTVSLVCISLVFSIVPLMTFITDAFGQYSASAMTAVLVIRCLMAAFLPLTVPAMAEKVGYGWAFTVLATIMLLLAPIPCLVMRYGPRWRQRSEYTKDK